jgi:hypothetical protein
LPYGYFLALSRYKSSVKQELSALRTQSLRDAKNPPRYAREVSATPKHFVAGSSDLDLMVTVGTGTAGSHAAHEGFFTASAALTQPAEVLGLEVSVLDPADVAATGLKRPFRSQFTVSQAERKFVSGAGHAGDPDLVLHIAVCRTAAVALAGPPAEKAFRDPGRTEILTALVSELEWARDEGDWAYAALNVSRALLYAQENVMSSKLEGWLWLRSRIADQSNADLALTAYLCPRAEHRVPTIEAPGFAQWAAALLDGALRRLNGQLADT